MIFQILDEFITVGVVSQDQADKIIDLSRQNLNVEELSEMFYEYVPTMCHVVEIMLKHNLYKCTESTPLRQALRDLFNENTKEWELLKSGNPKMNGFFMGRVFKKVGQIYNPKDVQDTMTNMVTEETTTYFWEI